MMETLGFRASSQVYTAALVTLFGTAMLITSQAYALQGKLESPAADSLQSGLGVVSGWVCDAERIEIVFDDRSPKVASYGTSRNDTATVCGDTDNGFGLLWNYALFGKGQHRVRAYADGILFADRLFTIGTIGDETFVTDADGSFTLQGFPDPTTQTKIQWNESTQNFMIRETQAIPPSGEPVPLPGLWKGRMIYDRASPGNACHDADATISIVYEDYCTSDIIDAITVSRDTGGLDVDTSFFCSSAIQSGFVAGIISAFGGYIDFVVQFNEYGYAEGEWSTRDIYSTDEDETCYGSWSFRKQ